uniref:RRM domain-containing protein n=1 Tax=Gibberella zeae (strain ATCC MYA-4620 / CBS 123657 / FGSC 9075 / NRRL 31084 / PH-1) TaxID=229533 RepID=A0A098E4K5_GIBZE
MSGKLDQALDDITQAQRRGARRRSNPRRAAGRPAAAAPIGGIQKNTKPARGSGAKPAPAKAAPTNSDSKIIVSNLPKDVSEQQIKDYFIQSVGPIKRVELVYGPNSQSRGVANVTFHKSDGASKAFQKLNGLLVDNRPIKIVVGAAQADKVIPTAKSLAERTSQPKAQAKAQPKSAAADKHNAGAAKGAAKGAANKKRRGRSSRPAKKTQEELDSEMADYFVAPAAEAAGNTPAPAAAPAPTADADMDEIAVCNSVCVSQENNANRGFSKLSNL